jgi:hypothetical protein
MDRAKALLDVYRADSSLHTASDQVRMAVVLGVAAMDSYFTTKFCDKLVPFLKDNEPTPGLIKILEDAGLDTKMALELVAMDRPYRRIRTLVERSFETHTTQRMDVVDELFLPFGLANFCSNAQGLVNRKNLVRRVEILVFYRHKIVHEGDLDRSSEPRKIDCERVAKLLTDLKLFIDGAEELIKKKIK